MKKRLLAIFAVAAGLTGGTVTLGLALRDANLGSPNPLSCKQWHRITSTMERGKTLTYYVAIPGGAKPPTASGSFVLGDCDHGVCRVDPQGCGNVAMTYSYSISDVVFGKRVVKIRSPPYFAMGWRHWASDTQGARFLKSWRDVGAECAAMTGFGFSRCIRLLRGVGEDCFILANGDLCRHGREYGNGLGGATLCTPAPGDSLHPCAVVAGQDPDALVAAEFPSDAELGE